jgi:dolichol-phosphate mannosyltransferase
MQVTTDAALATVPPPNTATRPAPELCVVVPTFNERANVPILIDLLNIVLANCDWEVIFVDDNSPDGTAAVASAIAEKDNRVRCIRRIGRRGLAGACLEGMLAS